MVNAEENGRGSPLPCRESEMPRCSVASKGSSGIFREERKIILAAAQERRFCRALRRHGNRMVSGRRASRQIIDGLRRVEQRA